MSTKLVFTEGWLRDYYRRTGTKLPLPEESYAKAHGQPEGRRNKYGNRRAYRGEEAFDSEHEARVYDELRLRLKAGEIRGISRQFSFELPGGVRYIADFVALNSDGTWAVIDAKSEATRKDKVYRIKRRLMRECLGIEIQEV